VVQKWNGKFFEKTTLTAQGLVNQIGHHPGDACSNPSPVQDLVVFELDNAHPLVVKYCACGNLADRVSKDVQLLRWARWFPAEVGNPSTAFTFDMLDFFHTLENLNKSNEGAFYHAIVQNADDAGLDSTIYKSDEIATTLEGWGYLKSERLKAAKSRGRV